MNCTHPSLWCRCRARGPRPAAFTLLELIVVITILGILGTFVAVRVTPLIPQAKGVRARQDLNTIRTAAETLYTLTGEWPATIPELVNPRSRDGARLPGLPELPVDPWERDYLYELGEDGPVVKCLGRDGTEGGDGEDADHVHPKDAGAAP